MKKTGEIFLLNWPKYNWNKSDRVLKSYCKELEQVKSNRLLEAYNKNNWIVYVYPMNTVWIVPGRKRKEKTEKEEDNSTLSSDSGSVPRTSALAYQNLTALNQ